MSSVTREIAEGVWACEQEDGLRIVRQVVIAGSEGVLVVDTGLPGAPVVGVLPLLAELERTCVTVLITHPDADHRGGAAEVVAAVPGARVLAGECDVALAANPDLLLRDRIARFSGSDDVPFTAEEEERARRRAGPPVEVAPVRDGAVVELGDRRVTMLATPGHSPGHTAAWLEGESLLAAGDAVMGDGCPTRSGTTMIPPMYSPPGDYLATVDRIERRAVELLVTAHDPVYAGAGVAAFLTASRRAAVGLEALVHDELGARPRTLFELCTAVCERLLGPGAGRPADLALTLDGHLGVLGEAGRVHIEPGPPRRFRRA
jgi:glyoxylase-like metal-dependent hydrolase (beta-lactamase superfamily II)